MENRPLHPMENFQPRHGKRAKNGFWIGQELLCPCTFSLYCQEKSFARTELNLNNNGNAC